MLSGLLLMRFGSQIVNSSKKGIRVKMFGGKIMKETLNNILDYHGSHLFEEMLLGLGGGRISYNVPGVCEVQLCWIWAERSVAVCPLLYGVSPFYSTNRTV